MNSTQQNNPARLIALMVILVLFSPMAIDIYLPAIPQMAADFNVNPVLVQDTVTLFMISLGAGQLFAGPLADRLGRRTVAIAGIAIYFVSSGLAYVAQSLDALLIARVLQGLGACATSVCAFAAVRDTFGAKRSGQMISYLNGAICFVPALAPLLGSWLTHHFGWRANFSFMLIYALIGLVLVSVFFRETRPADTDSSGPLFSPARYSAVLREPVFLYHASLCLLAMAVIIAYVTSAPSWLITHKGLTMEAFTKWFAANAVLNITAAMTAPKFMDRYGSRRALNLGLTLLVGSGALMMLLAPLDSALSFMLPIFISSFGFAWVLGAAAGKALEPFGQRAGTAAALLGLFQMTGAGALVSATQRLHLDAPALMTLHMVLLLPTLLLLWSATGKRLHSACLPE
ncbi:multidrug effflux MFS transporter [Veronia pacifica]|uniref:Bcr/CflA family efflux transporter n=1 Tax=Veronia pacifica TaxID=1080227 RepID=A0A1C3EJK7_9GAMM|nr:multidrug effflux MFS transporter [Veronia pacifica]ODA33403.1 Bcr/CflA family drug resistance efflux transporter [Veronia pacifica]